MIHIVAGQNDELMDVISEREVLFNTHKQSLENQLEQFDFECLSNLDYAYKLTDRNRLIIPSEEEGYIEFIIQNVIKTNDRVGVYTTASYLDLIKAKVIYPTTLTDYNATAALSFLTNETEWRPGIVESDTLRTITIDSHTNPFTMLKRVANEFDLELRFRTEIDGNRVTNRYVDLLDRVGAWDGREVTFGKDLDTIERSEDTSDIYTSLLCLGPEDVEGNRLEILVEDQDALQRWGRPDPITGELKHLIGIYEPQSSYLDMTLSVLEQYGRTELNKRINAVITYSANIVDLEHVPGMENKKIRFGDTVRIKDEKFNPPLYVEARVFEQSRDIFSNSLKEVKLGDFVEFTEQQVNASLKQLQAQIKEKISQSELLELTYDKPTIDGKDTQVKADAEQDATQKAEQAELVAKDHADQVASEAETNANNYTNTVKSQIDAELLDKAGLEYVDGQLALKADSALVNTINNTVADLETTASNLQQAVTDNEVALNAQGGRITTVETDLNTVEGQLSVAITDLSSLEGTVSSQGTQISANTSAISLKANQTELDTVSGDVTDLGSELNVLAGQVELKASQSALTNLANDVTQISSVVSSLQVGVNGITADVSSLESTVNGHTSDISSLSSQLTVQAGQISSKVDATYVTGAITNSKKLPDTRNDNQPPSWYWSNYPRQVVEEFKYRNVLGVSKGETYGALITVTPWSDSSGGQIKQTFKTGDYEFQRRSTGDSGWSVWLEMETTVGSDAKADAVYNYAESEINQLAGEISLKADSTTVDSMNTRLSSAELDINALDGAITSKVETSTFNTLKGRVDTAETTISQQADEIDLKVNKNGVISSINQTAETIKIQASKINLVGAVTVLSDITGDLGTINAGTINGVNINGSAFNQTGANGSITLDDNGLIFDGANSSIEMNVITTSGFHGDVASLVFKDDQGLRAMEIYQHYTDSVLRSDRALYVISGDQGLHLDGSAYYNAFGSPGVNVTGGLHVDGQASLLNGVNFGSGSSVNLDEYGNMIASANSSSVANWHLDNNIGTKMIQVYVGRNSWGPNSDPIIFRPGGYGNAEDTIEMLNLGGGMGIRGAGQAMLKFLTSSDEIQAKTTSDDYYAPIRASSFPTSSKAEYKRDIEIWSVSALDLINKSTIYDYCLKSEYEKGVIRRRQGLVIGEGYNTPVEIIDDDGVEQYMMNSWSWKAIQELSDLSNDHNEDINILKMKVQILEQKITHLEGAA